MVPRVADPSRVGTDTARENTASRIKALARDERLRNLRLALLPPLRLTYRTPWPTVPVREDLPFLLNALGLTGTAAEIGVRDGFFSEVILARWKGAKLISIDPWREFATDDYVDVSNVEQEGHEANLASTKGRLERFGARSDIWRDTSVEASARVTDASLDFAYLDARHDREAVLEDLGAWWPKVRPGGVLAGHDYVDGLFTAGDFGVKSAVDAFFGERGIRVRSTFGDPPWPSWYVLRPK
jgi:predicted O-methyltransferase YrrM